jgi:hypothetical protein
MLSINEAYTADDLEQTAVAIERVTNWFRSKR